MARTLPKERYLPSLLDRLTDDDPINNSIRLQQEKIKNLEKSLAGLQLKPSAPEPVSEDIRRQRQQVQQQLDQVRAQLSVLTTSVSSLKEIRACVKRDLNWLLNASQYSPQEDLDDYPDVARSVINYGMPDLTGKTVSGFDQRHMERLLKLVILNFEPRIVRNTLTVGVIADKTLYDHNALVFEIEGELWAEPQPLHLHLRTEFELEDGNVSVFDFHPAEKRP